MKFKILLSLFLILGGAGIATLFTNATKANQYFDLSNMTQIDCSKYKSQIAQARFFETNSLTAGITSRDLLSNAIVRQTPNFKITFRKSIELGLTCQIESSNNSRVIIGLNNAVDACQDMANRVNLDKSLPLSILLRDSQFYLIAKKVRFFRDNITLTNQTGTFSPERLKKHLENLNKLTIAENEYTPSYPILFKSTGKPSPAISGRPILQTCLRDDSGFYDNLPIQNKEEQIISINGRKNINISNLAFFLNGAQNGNATGIAFGDRASENIKIINNLFVDELKASTSDRYGDSYAILFNHKLPIVDSEPRSLLVRNLIISHNQVYGPLQLTGGGGNGLENVLIQFNNIFLAKYNAIAITSAESNSPLFRNINISHNQIISPKSLGIYIGPDKLWQMKELTVPGGYKYRPVIASPYGKIENLIIRDNQFKNEFIDFENFSNVKNNRSYFTAIYIRAHSQNEKIFISNNNIQCSKPQQLSTLNLTSLQRGIEIQNDDSRLSASEQNLDFNWSEYLATTTSLSELQSSYEKLKELYDVTDANDPRIANFQDVLINNNSISDCATDAYLDRIENNTNEFEIQSFPRTRFVQGHKIYKAPSLVITTVDGQESEYIFPTKLDANSSSTVTSSEIKSIVGNKGLNSWREMHKQYTQNSRNRNSIYKH